MVRKVTVTSLVAGIILALSLAIFPVRHASAQMSITWTTGFQVQNLGTGAADVSIQLYNQDGTVNSTITDTIPVSGSKTYYPVPNVAAGFNGSAVISSTQPVGAILNILGNAGIAGAAQYSEAANGIPAGGTANTVNLPLVMRANSGISTWFSVQNAGTTDASVTVAFTAGSAGTSYTTTPVTIKAGASHTFDQSIDTALGAKFIGSAKVVGTQALAVVVNQVGTGTTKTQLTYSGFASGSNSVVLPLVHQANATFFTGISVQNVGLTTANVSVNYSANTVGTAGLTNDTATLAPGASTVFIKNGATRYVGSATVTTGAADQQVVVVVNQLSTTKGQGTAYEGLSSSVATTQVSLPLLMNANAGFFTGVQCANLGASAVTMTLTFSSYTKSDGTTFTPTAVTQSVGPGLSANWLQNGLGQKYIGGGTVTSKDASGTAQSLVCIVNQVNDGTLAGDQFLTYNGINY